MRTLELTEVQLKLLQELLSSYDCQAAENQCKELGLIFEDFAELYGIVMLGAREEDNVPPVGPGWEEGRKYAQDWQQQLIDELGLEKEIDE